VRAWGLRVRRGEPIEKRIRSEEVTYKERQGSRKLGLVRTDGNTANQGVHLRRRETCQQEEHWLVADESVRTA